MKAILGTILLLASTASVVVAKEPQVLDRSCGKILCTAMLAIDRKVVGDGTKTVVEFVSAPAQTLDSVLGVKEGARHTFTAFCAAGTIRDEMDKSDNSLIQIREAPAGTNAGAVPPEKAALHAHLLKAAMDYACAPGAEVERKPPYFGTWASNMEQCANPESEAKMVIDEQGVKGWESLCEVRRTVQSQESQWWLVMDCEGEGETWKSTKRLTLLDKGKLLVEQSTDKSFGRSVEMLCPAQASANAQ
jgi:hypothetical protein